jgi:DNA-binding CsgD family transcriptional regulator
MVGRADELARLLALADRAADGDAAVALVSGDAGIGKSRLVDTLVASLADRTTVLTGACPDSGAAALPLLPLMGILRQLPSQIGTRRTDELLARLVDLHALAGGQPTRRSGDDHSASRLFGAVLDMVVSLAEDRPTAVVFEDLHWADSSTLALFTYLGSSLAGDRVLLVGTYRDDQVGRGHSLRSAVSALSRLPTVTTVALDPLDRGEIEALVQELSGKRPDELELDRLVERGEGNPFFTEQLVAAPAAGGDLPQPVADLLRARIEGLPDVMLDALQLIALCGFDVPIELLMEATGASSNAVEDALLAAVDARLLEPGPDGELRLRHALLAEAVLRTLVPSERRRLHLIVATHLDALANPTMPGVHHARLAMHWRGAGDPDRAFRAALAAADEADARDDPAAVHHHLEDALSLWGVVQDPESVAGRGCYVMVRASLAAQRAGQVADAVSLARRAQHGAASTGDLRAQLIAAERASDALYAAGDLPAARDAITAAERMVDAAVEPVDPLTRLRVGRAHIAMLSSCGQFVEAGDLAPALIELASKVDSGAIRADLLRIHGASLEAQGKIGYGLQLVREARRLALAEGHLDVYCHAAATEFQGIRMDSDPEEVLAFGYERLAATEGRPVDRSRRAEIHTHVADSLFRLGRWAQADAILAASPRGTLWTETSAAVLIRANMAIGRGDLSSAWSLLTAPGAERMAGYGPIALHFHVTRSRLDLAGNDPEAALTRLEQAVAQVDVVAIMGHGSEAAAVAAEAAAIIGDHDRGAALLVLADRALQMTTSGSSPTYQLSWRALAVAHLASISGPAIEAWTDAIDLLDAAKLGFEAAVARLHLGRALLQIDRFDEAFAALEAARVVFSANRAEPLIDEVDDLLASPVLADRRQPVIVATTGVAALSDRERDVLTLLAEGFTNTEIGERLYISSRTVGVHVSNVLRKLQVETRRQAGRLARQSGWLTPTT